MQIWLLILLMTFYSENFLQWLNSHKSGNTRPRAQHLERTATLWLIIPEVCTLSSSFSISFSPHYLLCAVCVLPTLGLWVLDSSHFGLWTVWHLWMQGCTHINTHTFTHMATSTKARNASTSKWRFTFVNVLRLNYAAERYVCLKPCNCHYPLTSMHP